jgi:hypothetical protein
MRAMPRPVVRHSPGPRSRSTIMCNATIPAAARMPLPHAAPSLAGRQTSAMKSFGTNHQATGAASLREAKLTESASVSSRTSFAAARGENARPSGGEPGRRANWPTASVYSTVSAAPLQRLCVFRGRSSGCGKCVIGRMAPRSHERSVPSTDSGSAMVDAAQGRGPPP